MVEQRIRSAEPSLAALVALPPSARDATRGDGRRTSSPGLGPRIRGVRRITMAVNSTRANHQSRINWWRAHFSGSGTRT